MAAKSGDSKKVDKKEEEATEDELTLRVDATIRDAGADELGIYRAADNTLTMKALLQQYTQFSSLTEVDEDGEHPLFPQSKGRGELRSRATRQLGVSSSSIGLGGEPGRSATRDLVDSLLRRLDNDRLPQIKDSFYMKDNALTSEEFVAVLRGHIGHVTGGDDRQVAAELAKLHARLCKGGADGGGGDEAAVEAVGETVPEGAEGAEGTEAAAEATEGAVVTWSMFARLLLDTGVVGDMVSSPVTSVRDFCNVLGVWQLQHSQGAEPYRIG